MKVQCKQMQAYRSQYRPHETWFRSRKEVDTINSSKSSWERMNRLYCKVVSIINEGSSMESAMSRAKYDFLLGVAWKLVILLPTNKFLKM